MLFPNQPFLLFLTDPFLALCSLLGDLKDRQCHAQSTSHSCAYWYLCRHAELWIYGDVNQEKRNSRSLKMRMNKLIFYECLLWEKKAFSPVNGMLITFLLRCLRTRRREAVVLVSKIHVSKVRKSHQAIVIVFSLLSQCWKLEVSPSVNNIALAAHGCFAGVKPTRLLLIQTKAIQENNSLHNMQYRSALSVTALFWSLVKLAIGLSTVSRKMIQEIMGLCNAEGSPICSCLEMWRCGTWEDDQQERWGWAGFDDLWSVFQSLSFCDSVKPHPSSELVLWWTDTHQTQTSTAQLTTNHLSG